MTNIRAMTLVELKARLRAAMGWNDKRVDFDLAPREPVITWTPMTDKDKISLLSLQNDNLCAALDAMTAKQSDSCKHQWSVVTLADDNLSAGGAGSVCYRCKMPFPQPQSSSHEPVEVANAIARLEAKVDKLLRGEVECDHLWEVDPPTNVKLGFTSICRKCGKTAP